MKRLKKALGPVLLKLWLGKLAVYGAAAFAAGAVICAGLEAVSKFTYISRLPLYFACIFAVSALAALIGSVIKRPGLSDAAKACDGLGFHERFITSLELAESGIPDNDAVKRLVIEDALQKARENNLARRVRLVLPRKYAILAGSSALVFLMCLSLPPRDAAELEKQRVFTEKIDAQLESIETLKENIAESTDLETAEKINARLEELRREIKCAKTEKEASAALQAVQEQLERVKTKEIEQAMDKLSESLAGNELTQDLAESAGDRDRESLKKGLEDLKQMLEGDALSEEEKSTLSELLETASKELLSAEELQQLIDGTNTALAKASGELKKGVAALEAKKSEDDSSANSLGQGGDDKSPGAYISAETGADAGKQIAAGTAGQSGSTGWGSGHIEDEQVYSRPLESKGGYDTQITGETGKDGLYETRDTRAVGEAGETVPYRLVIGQYKEEALRSLSDYSIPYGMHEMIKDYFSGLE